LLIILIIALILVVIGAGTAYWYFLGRSLETSSLTQPVPQIESPSQPNSSEVAPGSQPIPDSATVDKLTEELNQIKVDDSAENFTSSDTVGL